jgi:L,D-peptidoglycan transpeptidase YkuD (ErfK/YbiS/YcfS/YnhG family)
MGNVIALTSQRGSAAVASGQVITVEVRSPGSTVAVVRIWQLESNGRYVQVHGPYLADVGVHGVGPTREGLGRTPIGVFTLTHAFGNQANDNTRMPYFRAGPHDWWDENPRSALYNHHVISRLSPGGNSENLFDAGGAYAHAVVINYNTDPIVRGAGSGFFLHVSGGRPTKGCVAITARDLNIVMHWLNPAQHPSISIGVGAKALAVVMT